MGASHGKKRGYNIERQIVKNGKHQNILAYSDIKWEQPHQPRNPEKNPFGYPHCEIPSVPCYALQPDYLTKVDELVKPTKLVNPVKASKSHQELHRELLLIHKRGIGVENKPELQRVLEQRKREQFIRQRKQEEEARRKISPLEQELLKRQQKLEEMDKEQASVRDNGNTPEFIKVKENLRQISVTGSGENS